MANSAEQQPSGINLDTLSLDQLDRIKNEEEARLQALHAQFSQLRTVAARLTASQDAVSELSPASAGKQVMIPLTESLYVPGKLKDPTKLLVELGTGFYAEKSSKETNAFLSRKLKLVDANSENVTQVIAATRRNLEQITMAMQGKMMEIRARQEGAKHRTATEAE